MTAKSMLAVCGMNFYKHFSSVKVVWCRCKPLVWWTAVDNDWSAVRINDAEIVGLMTLVTSIYCLTTLANSFYSFFLTKTELYA